MPRLEIKAAEDLQKMAGHIVRDIKFIPGPQMAIAIDLEDGAEQMSRVTLIPGCRPALNGNILVLNQELTIKTEDI